MRVLIPVRLLAFLTLNSLLAGCISVLPSAVQLTDSSWKNYEEARQAFERIQPGQTSTQELWAMGFDPVKQPNIRILNHLDITRLFVPNDSMRTAEIHPDILSCLQTRADCRGYEVVLSSVRRDRYGNVLLDVFNFHRKTRISGWQFRGLIVLERDKVIYKLESGQPNTLEHEDKKNPLGPLQDMNIPSWR